MADSSTFLDLLTTQSLGKEYKVNALADAFSPAALFGRRDSATSGLQFAWYGGKMLVDGVLTVINNGQVTLTANATNYLQATRAGVVSVNTTGFSPGAIELYKLTTNASTITNHEDRRTWVQPEHLTSRASISLTSADVTLTAAEARCRYLTITGVLTNNRSVIVPNDWEGIIYNANTGLFTTTIKTQSGTGVSVGQTKRAPLFADGTNVVRTGPDT